MMREKPAVVQTPPSAPQACDHPHVRVDRHRGRRRRLLWSACGSCPSCRRSGTTRGVPLKALDVEIVADWPVGWAEPLFEALRDGRPL
jgi:hypothetical protein